MNAKLTRIEGKVGTNAYDNFVYQGKLLTEWCRLLKNQFTLGELYRLAKSNKDFTQMAGV